MSAITGVARINHGPDLHRAALDIEVERTILGDHLADWRVEVDGVNLFRRHMGDLVGIRFLAAGNRMFVEGQGLVIEATVRDDEPLCTEGRHWRAQLNARLRTAHWSSTIRGIGPLYDHHGHEIHWSSIRASLKGSTA